ncbi:hypothetical protein V6N12_021152 [Hibiscus sabdariffa]|uniref:Uncharacterized protein n=1 Tax=Hibiscus sabdariffa TaxID=183260 RepID=A0ABR2AS26_9ROSI
MSAFLPNWKSKPSWPRHDRTLRSHRHQRIEQILRPLKIPKQKTPCIQGDPRIEVEGWRVEILGLSVNEVVENGNYGKGSGFQARCALNDGGAMGFRWYGNWKETVKVGSFWLWGVGDENDVCEGLKLWWLVRRWGECSEVSV